MNDWDRDNLNFILNADEETFQQFLEDCSNDDIDYALSLIQTAKAELMTEELDLEDQLLQENNQNFPEAQAVLTQFRL